MLARTLFVTFHGIGDPVVPLAPGEGRYFVTEETYRRTIAALAALEARHGVDIRVTFDDGNLSDFAVGMPALAEAGRSGTFFVLAGRIGETGYLSGDQIRAMAAAGMSIGNHGWDHVNWRKLDRAGRHRELHDARRRIEDEAGVAVTEAAIPFGAFDRALLRHLKRAGYSHVCTSTGGLAIPGAWFRPRWSVTEDFDPERDLARRLTPAQVARGTAYACLRKARYRI